MTALLAPTASNASSHREAPFIAGQPQLDNTDVYAFTSPDDTNTVTMIANWIPFEEPNGGPNFYPFADRAHYDINIDNNGDAKADLTYRWTFTSHYKSKNTFLYNTGPVNSLSDATLNFTQTYDLDLIKNGNEANPQRLLSDAQAAPSFTGKASMPNYAALRTQAVTSLPGGGKTLSGQADDPFFLDLRIFDLLYGADLKEVGTDTLKGYNVNTIAVQVPKSTLALNGNATNNPVIGIWSTTSRPKVEVVGQTNSDGGVATSSKYYSQVSRLGNPLVNEVVVPVGAKDRFNASTPDKDAQFAAGVLKPEVPKLVESIYGIKAPAEPRNDLVEVFLTGVAKNAPTLDGSKAPVQADLNSQILNKDVDASKFAPSEELRLNMGVPVTASPNRLGVLAGDNQGYPNGRRLGDDVVDIELKALEGALPPYNNNTDAFTDGVDTNDNAFSNTFPYVALPNMDAVNKG